MRYEEIKKLTYEELKRRYSVKFSVDEEREVLEFALIQDNWNDTIRFLIQKAIAEYGIVDMSQITPGKRDKSYFNSIDPKYMEQAISTVEANNSELVIELNKEENNTPDPKKNEDNEKNEKKMTEKNIIIPSCYDEPNYDEP